MKENSSTKALFLKLGKREFLEHGFKGTSLRKIVSEAGFTLGAFYGYYASKEELFEDLVGEMAAYIENYVKGIYEAVRKYPPRQRMNHLTECFEEKLPEAVDYFLEHQEELRLILIKADGTRYEHFLENMVAISGQNVHSDRLWLAADDMTFTLLMGAYYSMLTKAILSCGNRRQIMKTMMEIQSFYQVGFQYFVREDEKHAEV